MNVCSEGTQPHLADRPDLTSHLASCERCAEEVREMWETMYSEKLTKDRMEG
jgi:hypothetical protein